ncbi:hypothetical protein CDL12_20960 [Handroanthus impetiginosus]|uniref:Uncharacterized protein n=1 Tax=Handroanthus impetiginosus TaxID=429701 RepID=A0A2G9GN82_9LAMI|nr:hypothetical protein CDL12_20960 [Handroanthus impetiginosus]
MSLTRATKKKNEELNSARVSSVPNAFKDAKEEAIFEEKKVINTETNEQKWAKLVSGTTTTEYVSWRMPHKKRGKQEPGFNLDYLPPKTHPPVHN